MKAMDDQTLVEIAKAVEILDAKVPKEGAAVQFKMNSGAPSESEIEANKLGCLRMGIEFLKAGLVEPGNQPEKPLRAIAAQIEELVTDDSEIRFCLFTRNEHLRPPPTDSQKRLKDRIALIGCALVALLLSMLAIGGILFWFGVRLRR